MKLIRESSNKKIKTSTADLYTNKILGKVEKYLDSACTTDMNPLEYKLSTLESPCTIIFNFHNSLSR